MRIDLPLCGLQSCRNYFDGNCKSKNDYDKCEYAYDKNRLTELEGKLESGLMIELPCKFGDILYVLLTRNGRTEITNGTVANVYHDDYIWWIKFCDLWADIPFSALGKTVFLTKSEAEIERRNHEKESN